MVSELRKEEAENVFRRVVRGYPVSREELIGAAQYFIFRSVRRTKAERVWVDLGLGLDLLREAGLPDIPDDARKQWGPDPFKAAKRACSWFQSHARRMLKEAK
jgi:hypothetical protein